MATIHEPSVIHVLPGTEVTFTYSPPASGPHRFPAPSPGVFDRPIDEAAQVAALEQGVVILQYGPNVERVQIASLEGLAAANKVVVAPGVRPFDNSASIAYTAWGHRQLCSDLDITAAKIFIESHAGKSADHNG